MFEDIWYNKTLLTSDNWLQPSITQHFYELLSSCPWLLLKRHPYSNVHLTFTEYDHNPKTDLTGKSKQRVKGNLPNSSHVRVLMQLVYTLHLKFNTLQGNVFLYHCLSKTRYHVENFASSDCDFDLVIRFFFLFF